MSDFELRCPLLQGLRLQVVSFSGREGLSTPYRFDLRVRGDQPLSPSARRRLVGERASFVFGNVARRLVHGVVRRVRQRSGEDSTGASHFQLTLVPGLELLRLGRTSRIFQERTSVEIASQILGEARLPIRADLVQAPPRRTYCVQHQESHLAFVSRILAEDGISFVFDHLGEIETVVLLDGSQRLPSGRAVELPLQTAGGLHEIADAVTDLTEVERARPEARHKRVFDWQRPLLELSGSAADTGVSVTRHGPRQIYDHHAEFEGAPVHDAVAALEHAQARRRRYQVEGASNAAELAPGARISVTGPHELTEPTLTVLEVEHAGLAQPGPGERRYENQFVAQPDSARLVPRRIPRSLQQALETATVVGPAGEEIHTDEHGRIKVRFHWDLDPTRPEDASCWIRVMEPWAGGAYGFQFIPRVGMEVVVLFTAGDTDQPLVVGAVPNTQNPVPFPLPRDRTKSGIRTRSTPHSAGFSELSFEDAAGRELVHVRAERDLEAVVQRERRASVGSDDTSTVGNDRQVHVGRDDSARVSRDRTTQITRHDTVMVGGHASQQVSGSLDVRVGGTADLVVARGRDTEITEADSLRIGGDLLEKVGGQAVSSVGGMRVTTTAGEHILLALGGPSGGPSLAMHGALGVILTSTGPLELAGQKITLTAGSSSLELDDDGLRIKAKKITVDAADQIQLSTGAAVLCLGDDATLAGGELSLSSSSASVKVASSVTVEAPQIALKSGAGSSGSKSSSRRDPTAPPPRLHISTTHEGPADGAALLLRNERGEDVHRVEASAAQRSHDQLDFELDPASLPQEPLEVVWRVGTEERVLVARTMLANLRDQLAESRTRQASAAARPSRRTTRWAEESSGGEVAPPEEQRRRTPALSPIELNEELQARLRALGALPHIPDSALGLGPPTLEDAARALRAAPHALDAESLMGTALDEGVAALREGGAS
ncbi:MAG: type VI secretion system tip protein TssI/VgrG [Polyangiaceae bacterium]